MSEETTPVSAKPTWMPKAIGLVVVLIVGAIVALTQGKKAPEPVALAEEAKTDVAVAETKPKTEPVATKTATSPYKDGIYSTTGNYVSPAGPETIDVTLTVKDGVVTESTVVANAENPVSVKLQGAFIDGYKSLVVGKKLAELSLSKVSGASLTTDGFNEALGELKTQATV